MSLSLPIDAILPALVAALKSAGRAVLQAPPGAGKTTRVPLAILQAGLTPGRIIMLEPRRLAARAAAERMAQTLGESVGDTVGFRIRGEARVGTSTRIEVVTEGILTRMLQENPDLPGIGAVIFDEFHERSLNADLGLALCLEVAGALRDDLLLVVMSATLDAEPVAAMIGAAVLTSEGRAFEVTSHWLPKPRAKTRPLEQATADLVLKAMAEHDGSALVFLPGEGEIRMTESLLRARLPSDVQVHKLFGAMDFKAQRAAIRPAETGRKIVLATSIAETSLTIEGIRIVVDAGQARRAEFDPSSGMSRLVTTRVSRAEALQRAGRAGRTASGVCYKLWTRGEDGALQAFPPAEIEVADLTGLALELALWGARPGDLSFVSPPHAGRMEEANQVLAMLGALDQSRRITSHGRALARFALHPRLAHIVERGGKNAPKLAALLSERDILRGFSTDLSHRVAAFDDPARFEREHGVSLAKPALARLREDVRRLSRGSAKAGTESLAVLAALAYPDRVGLRRPGDAARFILSGGKGAMLPDGDPLAKTRLLVATDLDGDPRETRIRQAVALSEAEFRDTFCEQIGWHTSCAWSRREDRVLARRQERFGALVLEDRAWQDAPQEDIAAAMLDGVRQLGLLPGPAAARFLARARLAANGQTDFPDFSEKYLMATLETWLLPHLGGIRTSADWKTFELLPALQLRLDYDQARLLDTHVPPHFTTPMGRQVPIDYDAEKPRIALRLQELFGVTIHPTVAGRPVQLTLLSPGHRPVQVTEDLAGFWATSYADVRKDMRGRYPKHPWPEDPTAAEPTLRAKPRK